MFGRRSPTDRVLVVGRLLISLSACGLLTAGTSIGADVPAVRLPRATLNGRPIGDDPAAIAQLQAGDVVEADIPMVLGDLPEWHFTADSDSPERLYVAVPGGPKQLVGLRIRRDYSGGDDKIVNPLETLSEAKIRRVWGIEIRNWTPAAGPKLALVDPDHCSITIHDGSIDPDEILAFLPAGLRTLRIAPHSNEKTPKLEGLSRLTQLRHLVLQIMSRDRIDARYIAGARRLDYLELLGTDLKNTETLASLSSLRELRVSYSQTFDDLAFAPAMTRLEYVNVSQTPVDDLSPLGGLPALHTIVADQTPVQKLPNFVPALKSLSVMSTALVDADVDAFRKAHPQCLVNHRWKSSLEARLRNVSRLRIRSGGTCHRDKKQEKTLYETAKADEITNLLDGIELVEERSGFHCMCCGEPSLEFYAADGLKLTLGFHHGQSLRWTDGWPGDAALTSTSADFLIEWLAERGVKGPKLAREEDLREELQFQRKLEQSTAGMPAELAAAFREGPDDFDAALAKLPDQAARADILLRVLGTSNDSWSSLDSVDQLGDEGLRQLDQAALAAAVERALLGDDRLRRRGAARIWVSWQSPLEKWDPPGAAKLYAAVLKVQFEARYYSTRMQGLKNLQLWQKHLGDSEIAERLAAGLADPEPQVRRQAALVAGEIGHKQAAELLMGILQGKAWATRELKEVPAWESQDVPNAFDEIAPDCSDADVAALALAYMAHAPAKSVIEAVRPATPMIEVALALLGDVDRLKPEHFATKNGNQQLQLAAVEAVVGCRGRAGLRWALDYQQATHGWEQSYVAGRLGRMLADEKAPGAEHLAKVEQLEAIRAWFDQHGAAYLAKVQVAK
jgi:hypothetical protein